LKFEDLSRLMITGLFVCTVSCNKVDVSVEDEVDGFVSEEVSISCPEGYALVPKNSGLGISSFCVMKYEAKQVSGAPVSQEALTPWTNLTVATAKTACTNLGTGYDLISNPEWMSISRNIEAQDLNWSSGAVGTGCLLRGNTGNVDACSYNGDNPEFGSSRDSKGKHKLSNGSEIWDLGGNVLEWVDWTLGGAFVKGPTTCASQWDEIQDVNCAELASADYEPANPAGVTAADYGVAYGVGGFYGGDASRAVPVRGGNYEYDDWGGIYTLTLSSQPALTRGYIGFRCVFRP
jgi:hypothetical protein